jgi:hypothetical protein
MPRGDRTGPSGMGPSTGRGMGFCTGNNQPGFASNFGGRGFGGSGFGRGWRNRNFAAGNPRWATQMPEYYPNVPAEPMQQMSTEQEIEMLKTESQNLQKSMENIEKRLAELTAEKE